LWVFKFCVGVCGFLRRLVDCGCFGLPSARRETGQRGGVPRPAEYRARGRGRPTAWFTWST
jgi:hypothetical protein